MHYADLPIHSFLHLTLSGLVLLLFIRQLVLFPLFANINKYAYLLVKNQYVVDCCGLRSFTVKRDILGGNNIWKKVHSIFSRLTV